jgi:hypothetical protein
MTKRKVTVRFDVEVPESVTDRQVEEWVAFHVGATGRLDADNPLSDRDVDAVPGSVYVL